MRSETSNFAGSGTLGVFETTAGGGKFNLWSILGIFLGSGVTSVLECLEARLLDSEGVGPKLKIDVTAPFFSLNLVLGRPESSTFQKETENNSSENVLYKV